MFQSCSQINVSIYNLYVYCLRILMSNKVKTTYLLFQGILIIAPSLYNYIQFHTLFQCIPV